MDNDPMDQAREEAQNALKAATHQIEETLHRGREKLAEMQAALVDRSRYAARNTDFYVHGNPWKAIGLAAGIGFIIGLLLRRD
jgi:ElaB/YqjD/DUF883 family membrane-anchored ribosome-binding protein